MPQPYAAAPASVTVQVRSSQVGTVAVHQERRDRSGPGPGQQTPGWSCSLHLESSRDGWQPSEVPVARVSITEPGVWQSVQIPAVRLAFFGPQRADQIAWSTLLASLGVRVDGCIDPWTQFDRLAVYQSGQRPIGARLIRVV